MTKNTALRSKVSQRFQKQHKNIPTFSLFLAIAGLLFQLSSEFAKQDVTRELMLTIALSITILALTFLACAFFKSSFMVLYYTIHAYGYRKICSKLMPCGAYILNNLAFRGSVVNINLALDAWSADSQHLFHIYCFPVLNPLTPHLPINIIKPDEYSTYGWQDLRATLLMFQDHKFLIAGDESTASLLSKITKDDFTPTKDMRLKLILTAKGERFNLYYNG